MGNTGYQGGIGAPVPLEKPPALGESKLSFILRELPKKQGICVVHIDEKIQIPPPPKNLDYGVHGWAHVVSITIAPKNPLFLANELESFIDGEFIADKEWFRLQPSPQVGGYRAYLYSHAFRLDPGRLVYEENAKGGTTIGGIPLNGKKRSGKVQQIPLKRGILITLYPSEEVARDIVDGKLERDLQGICLKDLIKYTMGAKAREEIKKIIEKESKRQLFSPDSEDASFHLMELRTAYRRNNLTGPLVEMLMFEKDRKRMWRSRKLRETLLLRTD